MLALGAVESGGTILAAVLRGQQCDASEGPQRLRELRREGDRFVSRAASVDREHTRTNARRQEFPARLELECERPRDRDRESRIVLEQPVEDVGIELEQHSVTHGVHSRRAR